MGSVCFGLVYSFCSADTGRQLNREDFWYILLVTCISYLRLRREDSSDAIGHTIVLVLNVPFVTFEEGLPMPFTMFCLPAVSSSSHEAFRRLLQGI